MSMAIRAEVERLFRVFGAQGDYIMSASDHFFDAPVDNLRAVCARGGGMRLLSGARAGAPESDGFELCMRARGGFADGDDVCRGLLAPEMLNACTRCGCFCALCAASMAHCAHVRGCGCLRRMGCLEHAI